MPLRIRIARVVALLLLLPAGLICVGVPVYLLTLDGGWAIIDDTRAAFGAGTDAGALKASYVDCTRQRSGSNSSRGIGMTEYACVIDLSETKPVVAPTGSAPKRARSYEEAMAEHNRSVAAALDAVVAQSKARSDVSNRIERTLATNRSGELPAVRILSAKDEPRRVGLVWGFGELAWRWTNWLVINLLLFGFGGFCLFAVKLAWTKRA
jgi:hypothetical protein